MIGLADLSELLASHLARSDWSAIVRLGIVTGVEAVWRPACDAIDSSLFPEKEPLKRSVRAFFQERYAAWTYYPESAPRAPSERATIAAMSLDEPIGLLLSNYDPAAHERPDENSRLAIAAAVNGCDLARGIKDDSLYGHYLDTIAYNYLKLAEWEKAHRAAEESESLLSGAVDICPRAYTYRWAMCLGNLGQALARCGRELSAANALELAIFGIQPLAQQSPEKYAGISGELAVNMCAVAARIGQYERAIEIAESALQTIHADISRATRKDYDPFALTTALFINLADARLNLPDFPGAEQAAIKASNFAGLTAERRGEHFSEDLVLSAKALSRASLALGKREAAWLAMERVLQLFNDGGRRAISLGFFESGLLALIQYGEARIVCGDFAESLPLLEAAIEIVGPLARIEPGKFGSLLATASILRAIALRELLLPSKRTAIDPKGSGAATCIDAFGFAERVLEGLLAAGLSGLNLDDLRFSRAWSRLATEMGSIPSGEHYALRAIRVANESLTAGEYWHHREQIANHLTLAAVRRAAGDHAAWNQALSKASDLISEARGELSILYLAEQLEVDTQIAQAALEVANSSKALAFANTAREAGESHLKNFRDELLRRQVQVGLMRAADIEAVVHFQRAAVASDLDSAALGFEAVELSRARGLAARVESVSRPASKAPRELVEEFESASQQLRGTAVSVRVLSRTYEDIDLSSMIEEEREAAIEAMVDKKQQRRVVWARAWDRRCRALDAVRLHDPSFDDDLVSAVGSLRALRDRAAYTGAAVLYYALFDDHAYALVVHSGKVAVKELPGASAVAAHRLQQRWRELCSAPAEDPKTPQREHELLSDLGSAYLSPVAESLDRVEGKLIVIAHRALHALPLHAATVREDEVLLDRFDIAYAPSGSAFGRGPAAIDPTRGGLVVDIDEGGSEPLASRPVEVAIVRERLARLNSSLRDVREGDGVTERLIEAIRGSELVHFSGHARFDAADEVASHLQLGEDYDVDARLTVEDVYFRADARGASLVVMNACETGRISPDPLDDHVSFATAFLHAGSAAVLATHWPVDDFVSLLLADRFYAWLGKGLHPSAALRESQNWLRGVPDRRGRCLAAWDDVRVHVDKSGFSKRAPGEVGRAFDRQIKGWACRVGEGPPFAAARHWAPYFVLTLG